jgi:hypothetical protein
VAKASATNNRLAFILSSFAGLVFPHQ